MSRRAVVGLGGILAGAGGYYLYRAGGDASVAQKEAEKDAAVLSNKMKNELPGKEKEIKKDAETLGERAQSKVDSSIDRARAEGKNLENTMRGYRNEASEKMDEARNETGNQLTKAVDKFDKTVEDGASKAKSGISSWFGGGK